jgi:hypothetical protein
MISSRPGFKSGVGEITGVLVDFGVAVGGNQTMVGVAVTTAVGIGEGVTVGVKIGAGWQPVIQRHSIRMMRGSFLIGNIEFRLVLYMVPVQFPGSVND